MRVPSKSRGSPRSIRHASNQRCGGVQRRRRPQFPPGLEAPVWRMGQEPGRKDRLGKAIVDDSRSEKEEDAEYHEEENCSFRSGVGDKEHPGTSTIESEKNTTVFMLTTATNYCI